MKLKINKGGLRKLKKDNKRFKLGAFFQLPKPETLPPDFSLLTETPLKVEHQRNSDFCTGEATGYLTELQEGVDIEPSWSFAISKSISGDYEVYGQDLQTAMKAHVKFGALEKKDSPYTLDTRAPEFLRRIENWPMELYDKAKVHQKESYFEVIGPYDPFDDIRASIWLFKAQKRAVAIGLVFSWPLSQVLLKDAANEGFGHAMAAVGFKTIAGVPHLEVLNSYGENAGDKGKHYVSREVINKYVREYGAFMFVDKPDLTKDEIILKSQQYRVNIFVKLYYALKELVLQYGKAFDGGKI